MDITLNAVAVTDKRIINREKDFCRLNAMRLAMYNDKFKMFYNVKSTRCASIQQTNY